MVASSKQSAPGIAKSHAIQNFVQDLDEETEHAQSKSGGDAEWRGIINKELMMLMSRASILRDLRKREDRGNKDLTVYTEPCVVTHVRRIRTYMRTGW